MLRVPDSPRAPVHHMNFSSTLCVITGETENKRCEENSYVFFFFFYYLHYERNDRRSVSKKIREDVNMADV